jgi:hypothetical protein
VSKQPASITADYHKFAERQTGKKMKRFYSDGGREYKGFLSTYFKHHGIFHITTCAQSSQQNGQAERFNQTIIEHALCMINQAGLGREFFMLAAICAAYIRNRIPIKALNGKTPYEMFFGRKPSYRQLKIFGCKAYVWLNKNDRNNRQGKLSDKAQEGIFVGYSEATENAYQIYIPSTQQVVTSHDVLFDEHNLGLSPSSPFRAECRQWINAHNIYDNNATASQTDSQNENVVGSIEANTQIESSDAINQDTSLVDENAVLPEPPEINVTPTEEQISTVPDNLTPSLPPQIAENFSQTVGANTTPNELRPDNEIRQNEPSTVAPTRTSKWSAEPTRRSARIANHQANLAQQLSAFISELPHTNSEIDTSVIEDFLAEPVSEPISVRQALNCADGIHWQKAMAEEIGAIEENNTWEVTDLPLGKKPLKPKWVFKIKRNADGTPIRYKGRIVVKGFLQKEGEDYTETFAPVAKFTSIRTLLALAAALNLELDHMDVVTAFLNGNLKEELFLEPPEGVKVPPGKILRLKKSLYGLKQSAREWYIVLDEHLQKLGFNRLEVEHCLYVRTDQNKNIVIIAVYVDDLLLAANDRTLMDTIKLSLSTRFKMKDLGPVHHLLGVNVERDRSLGLLRISQKQYLKDVLQRFGMEDCRPVKCPLDLKTTLSLADCPPDSNPLNPSLYPYRAVIGSLMYAMVGTRPDLAFAVSFLSRFSKNPGMKHWLALKRVLRYVKQTLDVAIEYGNKPLTFDANLIGYVDADHAADLDFRRSVTGYIFLLAGGPISWRSARQEMVAISTTEAEYVAAATAVQELRWLRSLLSPLSVDISLPTPLYGDNQSAIAISRNPEHHGRTKHIDVRNHVVRQQVGIGTVKYEYISTSEQIADLLTKGLGPQKLSYLCKQMGMIGF